MVVSSMTKNMSKVKKNRGKSTIVVYMQRYQIIIVAIQQYEIGSILIVCIELSRPEVPALAVPRVFGACDLFLGVRG